MNFFEITVDAVMLESFMIVFPGNKFGVTQSMVGTSAAKIVLAFSLASLFLLAIVVVN